MRIAGLFLGSDVLLGSVAGCGSAGPPKVTKPEEASRLINEYMNAGYSMWSEAGNPVGPSVTCEGANGQWIAGCRAWFYVNPRPIDGPPDSPWSYWTMDGVNTYDDGTQTTRTQCFGLIPPQNDFGTQLYEVDCTNTSRPG